MKQSVTTTLLAVLMSMVGINSFAYVAVANTDGVTIYYEWINNNTELAVSSSYNNHYTGTVVIPKSVNINGNTYPVTSIGNWAFSGCSGLTSVTIPSSVTSIGDWAFTNCRGLTSVTIPSSVTSIGKDAFYGCSGLTSVTIPSSVTSIGDSAFSGCSGLTSVIIPNSVTSIGRYAFDGCSGLTSVTIPNSVTSIGSNTFNGCSGLTSVTIPSSVTSIGREAFYGCSSLTSVTIPNSVTSIEFGAFESCSSLTSVTIPSSVTSIGYTAFNGCSGLTSIMVEGGNKNYDSRNNCNAIIEKSSNSLIIGCKNTTIPNSVTSIGKEAFYGCSGLTSITIPNSVESIGFWAFRNCSSLTSVTIGNSVTAIEYQAFQGCSGLTSIKVESGNQKYDSRNNCNAIIESSSNTLIIGCKNTIIPNSVTSIGGDAFYGCIGLTSVTIPSSVTSIGYTAFNGCSGLTSIMVEGGNKNYDSRNNCNAIIEKSSNSLIIGCKNTTIPNSVTSIGKEAFYGCSGLTSITIPNSVTYIGKDAFYGCSGLKTIYSELKTPIQIAYSEYNHYEGEYIYVYPFSDDIFTNVILYVPKETKSAYLATEGWNLFRNIVENVVIGDVFETDGIYYKIGENNTVAVTKGNTKYTLDVVIPSKVTYLGKTYSVTSIDDLAFYQCIPLFSVTIPNSVKSIGRCAFLGCIDLTSITIPNSVTSIDGYAFSECSSLISIIVESGNQSYDSRGNCNAIIETSSNTLIAGCKNTIIPNSVTSIGSAAFRGRSDMTSITIPNSVTSIGSDAFRGCKSLKSVNIPENVTSISDFAFCSCISLTYINIPSGVTSIGESAFDGCALTSITIPSKVTFIGDFAFYCNNSLKSVHISDLKAWCEIEFDGSAFFNAYHLYLNGEEVKDLVIPNSVTSIGSRAFRYCSGLTSITIPNSVTSIGSYAFSSCSDITSVIIGKGVKSIGNAFYKCNNLKEMILSQTAYENGIPENVTKFTTYSKDPMRVVVTSKGATSATMKIYPIDDRGNTNEDNCYTVTMLEMTPGQYIKWKLDDENYGVISEKTEGSLTFVTQPAQPTSTTKARLISTINEADDDQHFGFEWLRNDAPGNMPANKVYAPLYEGKIIGSLSGLNPDIYYKYRPFYQSDNGETYYGEWIAFLTGDANVFFEPETHTKEASEITEASAQLAGVWIEGTEDTEEKGFEYWTVSKANTRAAGSDAKTVTVSGNQTTITIDDLVAGKEYGYRTYVKTASGTTYGEEKTFKTILMGDANDDGEVNSADVDVVANHIIAPSLKGFNKKNADMNHDNEVNAADIVEIVKIVNGN